MHEKTIDSGKITWYKTHSYFHRKFRIIEKASFKILCYTQVAGMWYNFFKIWIQVILTMFIFTSFKNHGKLNIIYNQDSYSNRLSKQSHVNIIWEIPHVEKVLCVFKKLGHSQAKTFHHSFFNVSGRSAMR